MCEYLPEMSNKTVAQKSTLKFGQRNRNNGVSTEHRHIVLAGKALSTVKRFSIALYR